MARLKKDKRARIDAQYYLKNAELEIDRAEIASFLARIKRIAQMIPQRGVERLRELLLQRS